jgi:glyoxalase family protein
MSTAPVLRGLHHVTAVTADARLNLAFYTRILGMRLVKKTVNQDDVSAYHLFYADELGQPGTELTFFEWTHVPPAQPGAGAVTETALRVTGGTATLEIWREWFDRNGVTHGAIEEASAAGFPSLPFQDPEGQRLRLIAEPRAVGTVAGLHPWSGSPLPPEASVVGLGAVTLTVPNFDLTARALTETLGFRASAHDASLFETGEGGPGRQLRLLSSRERGTPGAGGVHHVAWAVADLEAQHVWREHLARHGVANSGLVDRFYFQSLYFRIPGGILFEIATEGPGFTADGEDPAHLGERLSLPPFLEKQRAQIEAGLRPLDSGHVRNGSSNGSSL